MASAERENTYSFIDPLCGKYAFHIFCSEWEGITADLELRFSIVLSTLDELEDIVSDYSKIQAQFLATKTIMYNGTIAYAYEHVKGQGALSTPGGGRIFDDVIIYTDRSIKELVFDLFTEEKIRLMTTEEIEASVLRYIEWLEFYVDALVCLSSSYGTMTICKYDKTKDIEVEVENIFFSNGQIISAPSVLYDIVDNKIAEQKSIATLIEPSIYLQDEKTWFFKIPAVLAQSIAKTIVWTDQHFPDALKRRGICGGVTVFDLFDITMPSRFYIIRENELYDKPSQNDSMQQNPTKNQDGQLFYIFNRIYELLDIDSNIIAIRTISAQVLSRTVLKCFIDSDFSDIIKQIETTNKNMKQSHGKYIDEICQLNQVNDIWIDLLVSVNSINRTLNNMVNLFDLLDETQQIQINQLMENISKKKEKETEIILVAIYEDITTDEQMVIRISTGGTDFDKDNILPFKSDGNNWYERVKMLITQCYTSRHALLTITFSQEDESEKNEVGVFSWKNGRIKICNAEQSIAVYQKLLPAISDSGTSNRYSTYRPGKFFRLL